MKQTLTVLLLLITFSSFATIKTTVANGDWFDANNWNPAGVPLSEDTVIINHIITASDLVDYAANWMIIENNAEIISDTIFSLHGNYKGYGDLTAQYFASGDGDSTLIYGDITGDHFAAGNPVTINYGNVFSDTLSIGSNFENRGLVEVNMFSASGTTFINKANAAMTVVSTATFSSTNSTNESNATIVTGDFVTSADFTNNGDVTCVNWTHGSGTIDGTTGRFCIDQCFVNNSTINGTVDICDASPGGICDIDMGTIAGTVTNCSNGACGNNAGLTPENTVAISVFPNPADDYIQLDGITRSYQLKLVDLSGRVVKNEYLTQDNTKISVNDLVSGTYILHVLENGQLTTMKVVIQ